MYSVPSRARMAFTAAMSSPPNNLAVSSTQSLNLQTRRFHCAMHVNARKTGRQIYALDVLNSMRYINIRFTLQLLTICISLDSGVFQPTIRGISETVRNNQFSHHSHL